MSLTYPIKLEPDDNGTLLVTFLLFLKLLLSARMRLTQLNMHAMLSRRQLRHG